ncbi:MAG: hypothetical protein SF182_02185 [Deltaproteobacteria bacterium]|nr:hypothetical protein [Deltaproteobacteria bacterium]
MRVPEGDRQIMRRIGAAKAAAHAQAAEAHRALPLGERLRRSLALAERGRSAASKTVRPDDRSPFYDRARALGLYRP